MKFAPLLLFTALFAVLSAPLLAASTDSEYMADMTFTLRTAVAEGKLVYIGQGGEIDGQVNPTLRVPEDTLVQINMINGDGALHDVVAEAFEARSDRVSGEGSSSVLIFRTGKAGEFFYWCSVPGHRAAGMEGRILVGEPGAEARASIESDDLSHSPMDLPPAIGDQTPTLHIRHRRKQSKQSRLVESNVRSNSRASARRVAQNTENPLSERHPCCSLLFC